MPEQKVRYFLFVDGNFWCDCTDDMMFGLKFIEWHFKRKGSFIGKNVVIKAHVDGCEDKVIKKYNHSKGAFFDVE